MSRIYRPRERAVIHHDELPAADLLREVRDIERRRVLLDLRDAIDRIPTTERSERSYGSQDRTGAAVKKDVLAALRRLKEKP